MNEHLIWPAMTLLFALAFVVIFRDKIRDLLSEIKEITDNGVIFVNGQRGSDDAVSLDAAQTKDFLAMYQESLAFVILKEVDKILDSMERDPNVYNRQRFVEAVWSATTHLRERLIPFCSNELGGLYGFVCRVFPEYELRRQIEERCRESLEDPTKTAAQKRRIILTAMELVQAKLRETMNAELHEKKPISRKRKGK